MCVSLSPGPGVLLQTLESEEFILSAAFPIYELGGLGQVTSFF